MRHGFNPAAPCSIYSFTIAVSWTVDRKNNFQLKTRFDQSILNIFETLGIGSLFSNMATDSTNVLAAVWGPKPTTYLDLKILFTCLRNGNDGRITRIEERIDRSEEPLNTWTEGNIPVRQQFHRWHILWNGLYIYMYYIYIIHIHNYNIYIYTEYRFKIGAGQNCSRFVWLLKEYLFINKLIRICIL